MSLSQSPEFHINVKNPPIYDNSKHYWEQSDDVIQYYEEERKKITYGINVNGYHIHPWLYFHANYFHTPIPLKDKTEPIIVPPLRDNEIFLCENYADAERLNKGLIIYGSRRFAKSSNLASMLHWKSLTKPNSQATVAGGSKEDLEMITRLIETSMGHINHAFYMENNSNDWTSHIQLGLKTKSNTPLVYSDIYIRNLEKGQAKKSEKTAGAAPSIFILDEALQKDTLVYTKDKNIPIKDIQVDDEIYGGDGKLTKVLEKHEFKNRQLYKITFSDGREIECCENHLWEVKTKRGLWKVKTTKEIRDKITYSNPFKIRAVKPLQYPEKNFIVDPYILGYHLGDGDTLRGRFCSLDKEPVEMYKKYYDVTSAKDNLHHSVRGLITDLKKIGLGFTKFIPDEYFYGSESQRRDLLSGLLDSDAGVTLYKGSSRIMFTNKNENIANGVVRLARSLGYKTNHLIAPNYTYDKNTKVKTQLGIVHRVEICTKDELFKIKVKNEKLLKHHKRVKIHIENELKIQNIELSRTDDAVCIKVDNEDKLFIAGDYIVTHNCGKMDCIAPYTAALPSFKTPYGWKCVPILAGTSGNKELSQDAVKMMLNPDTYDLLPMNWDRLENRIEDKDLITWKRRVFGTFVPGQFGYEDGNIKKETNLKNYLRVTEPSPDLEKIKVQETDWRLAKGLFIENRRKLIKDRDEHSKYTMYYPLDVDDILRADNGNPFPIKEAQRHKQALIDKGETGKEVDLIMVGGKIQYQLSEKRPIEDFPFTGGTHDAPVLLFTELPDKLPPRSLNVAGLDPYKQTKSGTESVGAMYILRREGLLNDPMAGCILASYASRPPIPDYFDRTCEYLLDAFNAECLMENADIGFIRYLEQKNKAEFLLANGVDFSKKINPNASANTPYGLYPTPKNQSHLMKGLLNYCNEELIVGFDENNEPIKALGIVRINDIYLLEEIINYKAGGNFDRMVGFAHALAWADYLDMIGVKVESGEQQEKRETLAKHKRSKLFTTTNSKNRWN